MARFLFVVLPLAGHVNAALAVAAELESAGHEVAWCGPESELRPLVGPHTVVHATGKRFFRQYRQTGMAAVRSLWDGYLIPANRFIRDAADRAVADWRPDVVVADQYAMTGALAAIRHGVPWATLCTGALELTPPAADLPDLAAWVAGAVGRVWALTDLTPDPAVDLRFSPHLVLALTTGALTGAVPLPPNCALVGPALGPRPADPGFDWSGWAPDRRHVLVTVGTSSEHMARDFYARTASALGPLADTVQAVFVAGEEISPKGNSAQGYPPIITAPRVPMLDLLPRLDAVVCHAGLGTVTESLAHGVPLVVAPVRHDQPAVARQVTAAGAGVEVAFDDAPPERIRAALEAVLTDPRHRSAAAAVAASFRAAGGARAAAARLAVLAPLKSGA